MNPSRTAMVANEKPPLDGPTSAATKPPTVITVTLRWARDAPTALDEMSAITIVPRPLGVMLGRVDETGCVLRDDLVISYTPELVREARWFRAVLEAGTGWLVNVAPHDAANDAAIELRLTAKIDLPLDVA